LLIFHRSLWQETLFGVVMEMLDCRYLAEYTKFGIIFGGNKVQLSGGKMPSLTDKGHKNLTLRVPNEFHRQLVAQADRSGLTLNAHLSNILRGHLMNSGFYPDIVKSFSGRLFEINVEAVPQDKQTDSYFYSRFDVFEQHPLYNKRRAHYLIGIADELVFGGDPYGLVKDVGIALLNFYNRQGHEIDQLAWQKAGTDPESSHPTIKDNWRYIGADTTRDPAQFLIALGRNHWKDKQLIVTGQSQDIRWGLRTEDDLYGRPRSPMANKADFERYAYDVATAWARLNGSEELTREASDDGYEVLPRYIQKQIDYDEFYDIVLQCQRQIQRHKSTD